MTAHPLWSLDPGVTFLNHGSFGACPIPVLEAQQRLRDRMEREPVRFLGRELPPLLDEARAALAAFMGAGPEDLAFVPNATTGVNTVLRSLRFGGGDEILVTDHAYNACRNALDAVAAAAGARVVVAPIPFPLAGAGEVIADLVARVTPATRLALVDHVTSPTGLVLPLAGMIAALAARGVDALVDGAHAPGMVPLDLRALGAAYYTGNCHKWICAPKGSAFLYVRADRRAAIRPLVVSHGANSPRTDRTRFHLEFDWTGTHDPTPYLAVPEALRVIGAARPGGWAEVMADNRRLALAARRLLCEALDTPPPCPDDMIGSLASVRLPADHDPEPAAGAAKMGQFRARDPLQDALFEQDGIEVPVMTWPAPPRRLLRISAQLYNRAEDYGRLARALRRRLA
jgi:isopenicillin-N epimerase